MSPTIRLYGTALSGHSHRIALALSLLDLPFESVAVDMQAGGNRTPEFLALNPFGQVPVLDDDGTVIPDSNAILAYLGAKYDDGTLMPRDPVEASEVQRWFSVAAGEIKYGPATARLVKVFGAPLNHAAALAISAKILPLLDAHLAQREYLAADRLTFADVAIYSYVAHAPEGDVDLAPYTHVGRWLARIEAHPRFFPFPTAAEILG
ncbi:glutathione S-transferase [Thalassobaculum sp. OXR-137]|uniref:glutathione S-transferase family protein n=1 Tax=Thalassobaculum sp. OXR-137 TaxID=3100173 RepID=UPI002AC8B8A9|nr:glutathione S-transferase [Thalassobaculum sp. OXR-137]WPZ33522.1 glutathione S-transferase [Thalassobaculum sp. OXR-137]